MGNKIRLHACLSLGLVLVLAACGTSGNGSLDAGTDAGQDAGQDASSGADHDPVHAFLLNVPAGTSLCGGFAQGRGWELEMALLGQIELAPGAHVFARQAGIESRELVSILRMGPDAEVLQATGQPGELETIEESTERWRYQFTKHYTWNAEPVRLELQFVLSMVDQAWPAELTLPHISWPHSVSAKVYIGAGLSVDDEIQAFGLCDLGDSQREIYTGTILDASRSFTITLQQGPWYEGCMVAGETACLFFIQATLQAGDFSQTVTDRFRLIYAGNHHNWFDDHLVLLDPPRDNEAAWLILEPDHMGNPGQLTIMDSSFNEIETHEITDWQIERL
ncbi:MAG: hypothetical protein JRF33_13545 [Deltaproteobacteria bacterium]|nr:hypothetical protein [Deltaproteobacteria bacterium]